MTTTAVDPILHLYELFATLEMDARPTYTVHSQAEMIDTETLGQLNMSHSPRGIHTHFNISLLHARMCDRIEYSKEYSTQEAIRLGLPEKSLIEKMPESFSAIVHSEESCIHASLYFDNAYKRRINNGTILLPAEHEVTVDLHIVQPSAGTFVVDRSEYTQKDAKYSLRKKFADIPPDADFRPYVHRMMELYAGVPVERWHSPQSYYSLKDHAQTTLVAQTASSLLTASEYKVFSKMRTMREFCSVPTLSLGAIRLPAQDLAKGAPLLAKYLCDTPLAHINAQLAQRLANYVMGEFQKDTANAQQIIKSLEGR